MARYADRKQIRHAEQKFTHAGCRIVRGSWTWIVTAGKQVIGEADLMSEAEIIAERWQRAREIERETAEAFAAEREADARMREVENHGARDIPWTVEPIEHKGRPFCRACDKAEEINGYGALCWKHDEHLGD